MRVTAKKTLAIGILAAGMIAAPIAAQAGTENAIDAPWMAQGYHPKDDPLTARKPYSSHVSSFYQATHNKHEVAYKALKNMHATGYTLRFKRSCIPYCKSDNPYYGMVDWETNTIMIFLDNQPKYEIPDTVAHEYGHLLQSRTYDLSTLYVAYGTSHLDYEDEADYIACSYGAVFVSYIGHCPDWISWY